MIVPIAVRGYEAGGPATDNEVCGFGQADRTPPFTGRPE
jgi:hypothetical protein